MEMVLHFAVSFGKRVRLLKHCPLKYIFAEDFVDLYNAKY
jgi:hypothetical protein